MSMSKGQGRSAGAPMSNGDDAATSVARERAVTDAVPVVDLAGFSDAAARPRVARAICDAFERFGFVRLTGHEVDPALHARVEAAFARFFAWPETRKQCVSGVAGGQRGYTAFGREHARDRARPDPKAFYHVGQPRPLGPSAADLPPNVFPPGEDALREDALALFAALERASARVLQAVELGLGLEAGALAGMIDGGNSILRALHYPALDRAGFAEERAADPTGVDALGRPAVLRAAPHEDINLVTLLPGAEEAGLEILWHEPGAAAPRWLAIPARPGEIVADVGDMLARFTGGRLPATTHRVVVTAEAARRPRSAHPFFAHPRPEADLSVHPAFVPEGGAPPWPPITAGAFLEERLREIGLVE